MLLQTELFYSYTYNMIFITWKVLGAHLTNEMFVFRNVTSCSMVNG